MSGAADRPAGERLSEAEVRAHFALLDRDLSELSGVSARRRRYFAKLDIHSYLQLLHFFPRGYEDWTRARPIASLRANEEATFVAVVARQPSLFRKGKLSTLRSVLRDESGAIPAVWFNQPYLEAKLLKGRAFLFRGKVVPGRAGLEIRNPAIEALEGDQSPLSAAAARGEESGPPSFLRPIYPLTAGLTQGVVRKLVGELLDQLGEALPEILPDDIRRRRGLAVAAFAYAQIHRPESEQAYAVARHRLAYEELFLMQLGLRLLRSGGEARRPAMPLPLDEARLATYRRVLEGLPYRLTGAQRRVLNEIARDLARSMPMQRLVQGDVGSGKTVVAALAMLQAVMAGGQAAFLAPTAVLAQQHFATLSGQLAGADLRIALLTGRQPAAEKRRILEAAALGEIDILVGTHALLEKKVQFRRLALTVTDEQHRFGVRQRLALDGEELQPHALVMSATPIPRSLGLILYGDLDISLLDEKPAGRSPIRTRLARQEDEEALRALLRSRVAAGEQAYVICPMVRDSEAAESLESVERTYRQYKEEAFPDLRVGLLHGGLNEREKSAVMEAFYAREIDILVATTVVEVGVDNPNATLMLIKNAERFGLAQLHQLRGRVGRGAAASACILQSDKLQGLARERLEKLCASQDGFALAEEDLRLRGPGDFFGTRQHGVPELRIANLYEDAELLAQSQEDVLRLLREDPRLEQPGHRLLWPMLERYFGHEIERVGL